MFSWQDCLGVQWIASASKSCPCNCDVSGTFVKTLSTNSLFVQKQTNKQTKTQTNKKQRNKQTHKQTKLNSGVSISFLRLTMLTISCRCYIIIDDVSRYAWNRSTLNKSCFP
jgi:hypothetical protein